MFRAGQMGCCVVRQKAPSEEKSGVYNLKLRIYQVQTDMALIQSSVYLPRYPHIKETRSYLAGCNQCLHTSQRSPVQTYEAMPDAIPPATTTQFSGGLKTHTAVSRSF